MVKVRDPLETLPPPYARAPRRVHGRVVAPRRHLRYTSMSRSRQLEPGQQFDLHTMENRKKKKFVHEYTTQKSTSLPVDLGPYTPTPTH